MSLWSCQSYSFLTGLLDLQVVGEGSGSVRLWCSKREAAGRLLVVWVDGGSLGSGWLNTGWGWTRETNDGLSRELGRVDSSAGWWEDIGSLRSSNRACVGGGGRSSSNLGGEGQNSAVKSLRELHLDAVGGDFTRSVAVKMIKDLQSATEQII